MRKLTNCFAAGLALLSVLILSSCGGGNGSDQFASAPAATAAHASSEADDIWDWRRHLHFPVTLCGTVATGAALSGASITVTDSKGDIVGTTTSESNGTFSVTPARSAVAPFVLRAVSTETTLVSMVPDVRSPVVNITSLTNLIASLLSSTGDPLQLAQDITVSPATITRESVRAAEAQVATLIEPVAAALGVHRTDYVSERFAADGRGPDRLLDSLQISIRPTGQVADIQISIRELLADGTQPTTLIFTNKTVPTAVDYAVELANLIPEGLSEEITSLVDQLTACYAVPVTTRASGNQVVAPACTALFYNGNSTTYLNSGNTVSPTGSFSGIFAADATGATFSEGTYLYSRTIALPGGGSATAPVVRIKVVGPSGNTSYFVATLVAQDGSLVLLGDQYAYSGSVAGLSQQRLYINESAASFVSTGLSYNVNNQTTTSNGVTTSIFNRIVVTVAGTSQYTLLPTSGYSYMVLQQANGSASSTNIVRLSSTFLSAATTAAKGSPSTYTSSLVYASPALTDSQIAALPDQTAVEYQYFLAGNTSSVPDATQYYRTEARPFTLAEFIAYTPELPALTQPSLASLISSTLGTAPNLYFAPPSSGPLTVGWSTPSGAPPVSSLNLFGYVPGVLSFNDNTSGIPSTASSAPVYCQAQTSADPHCTVGNYVSGDALTGIQLQAPNLDATNFQNYYIVEDLY
jgi:hypothetical protein